MCAMIRVNNIDLLFQIKVRLCDYCSAISLWWFRRLNRCMCNIKQKTKFNFFIERFLLSSYTKETVRAWSTSFLNGVPRKHFFPDFVPSSKLINSYISIVLYLLSRSNYEISSSHKFSFDWFFLNKKTKYRRDLFSWYVNNLITLRMFLAEIKS